jgi:hypothetical protein
LIAIEFSGRFQFCFCFGKGRYALLRKVCVKLDYYRILKREKERVIMSSFLRVIILAIILIAAESYSKINGFASSVSAKTTESTTSRFLTNNNAFSVHQNQGLKVISGNNRISSFSSSRLYAAAPDAPKGRGPPPRKAPKDDVVQVGVRIRVEVCDRVSDIVRIRDRDKV